MNFETLNDIFNGEVPQLREFYNNLSDVQDLMKFCEWRKGRAAKPEIYIHNGDAPSDVVTVVLTPDADDEYAMNCRHIFSHHPIVFSCGVSPYFNEPHHWNEGIKVALKLNPKWVVLSTDDMYEVDRFSSLTTKLSAIDNKVTDAVWVDPEPDGYHSCESFLAPRLAFEKIYRAIRSDDHRGVNKFYKKFQIQNVVLLSRPVKSPFRYWLYHTVLPPSLYSKGEPFVMTGDFAVLSSEFVKWSKFNELYPRHGDIDFSLRLRYAQTTSVDFKIGSYVGGHLAPGIKKAMKEITDLAIFNELLRMGHYL
jgi:hypothetical protein